jgi:hypothetical protein
VVVAFVVDVGNPIKNGLFVPLSSIFGLAAFEVDEVFADFA